MTSWRWLGDLLLGTTPVRIITGSGDPTGVITANQGSLYVRNDGAAGTTLYVKEIGSGNAGWSTASTSFGSGGVTIQYPSTIIVTAKTNLTAGQIVTIFQDVDTIIKAKPSDATADTSVSGYVTANFSAGASATVFLNGTFALVTAAMSAANIGAPLYLHPTITGAVTLTPTTSAHLYQRVGTLIAYNSGTSTATIFFHSTGLTSLDVEALPIIGNIAASQVTSGLLALNRGGTGADLSATGGTSFVLRQSTVGGAVTVSQLNGSDLALTDITTNNVSITAHGFTPKLPNDSTKFLNGVGSWVVPSNTGGGTVNSVAMTGDGTVFNATVTGSPVTTSGTLAPSLVSQSANKILAGPSSGVAAAPTFRSLVNADIPAPTLTALGGVQAVNAVAHNWISSINTSGVPQFTQPSVTDLSDGTTGTGVVVRATTPTFVTSALFPDGSSSVPSIAFASQTNTGIFKPAAGQVSITAAGVIAATFTSGGIANVVTGIQINGAATTGNVLRGNGTNFVPAVLAASDLSNGTTGSGAIVLATSPVLVTPTLGVASATEVDVTTLTLDASNKDVILTRSAAATLRLGNVNSATPVNQTVTVQGSRGGTDTNTAGGNLTITSGTGTGSAAASTISFQTPTVGTTGTAAQTLATRVTVTSTSINPGSAGGLDLGATALPYSNLYIGNAATNNIKVTGTATAARTFTLPDANSNPVQPSTAAAHQFATAISATGVVTWTQPVDADISFSNITTGNVSTSAHGYAPILPNNSAVYFNGAGTYTTVSRVAAIHYVIDGAGQVPTTGVKGQINMPSGCTITGWVLTADQSGSAVIDVLRSTYAGFPTTSSIAGTDKPTLSSVQKNENLAVSAWTTAISAGDQIQFNLNSVTTCTRLNLTINVTIP